MDAQPGPDAQANEAPPQFSPDGRFWWDGTQWIATEQLQRPSQFEPASGYPDPWHDEHQESRSLTRVGLVLLGLGVVLILGWAVFQFHIVKLH